MATPQSLQKLYGLFPEP